MADRYFVDVPISGDRAVLSGSEAHHLGHVLRAKSGDEVVLFDGTGREFTAQVARVSRDDVELTVLAGRPVDRELPLRLIVGVALPKGDRQRWLIEKVVELGVSRLVPLHTQRGVAEATSAAAARLRRAVIQASKQCGRNRLMEIVTAEKADTFLRDSPRAALRLLGHPGGQPCAALLAREQRELEQHHPDIYVAVGPEGGFSPDEVESALGAGWQSVSLGSRVLRVETAAVGLAAICAAHCEPIKPLGADKLQA